MTLGELKKILNQTDVVDNLEVTIAFTDDGGYQRVEPIILVDTDGRKIYFENNDEEYDLPLQDIAADGTIELWNGKRAPFISQYGNSSDWYQDENGEWRSWDDDDGL